MLSGDSLILLLDDKSPRYLSSQRRVNLASVRAPRLGNAKKGVAGEPWAEEAKEALVIVPDYQLSLAIGKEGQNARLAARLTGYKIDIKSETQAKEQGLFEELGIQYQEDMVDYNYQDDESFQEGEELQEAEESGIQEGEADLESEDPDTQEEA